MEWYEELTGMSKADILAEMQKPRDQWCRAVLQLVVAILLADRDVSVFTCKREDMEYDRMCQKG